MKNLNISWNTFSTIWHPCLLPWHGSLIVLRVNERVCMRGGSVGDGWGGIGGAEGGKWEVGRSGGRGVRGFRRGRSGASGGPIQHTHIDHHQHLTRDNLVSNTKILCQDSNHNKLSIIEALLIRKIQPSINNQCTRINKTLNSVLNCPPSPPMPIFFTSSLSYYLPR